MTKRKPKWLAKFVDFLSERTDLSKATIQQIAFDLRKAAQWFSQHNKVEFYRNKEKINKYGPLMALEDQAVFDYMNHLAAGRTLDTRKKISYNIRRYLRYLEFHEKIIIAVPDFHFKMKPNGNEGSGSLEQVTMNIMARQIRPHLKDGDFRTSVIIQTLSALGLRIHELLALKFEDVEPRVVLVKSTKTKGKSKWGGDRRMIVTNDLRDVLEDYAAVYKLRHSDPLFPIGRQTVYNMVKGFGSEVGLPWLSPHKFRHYCITRFASVTQNGNETPVFTVAELSMMFGVSPKEIVETYMHPEIDDVLVKAEALGVFV